MNSKSILKIRNEVAVNVNGVGNAIHNISLFGKHDDEPPREPEHLPLNPFNMPIVTSTHPQVMKWHVVVAVAMVLVASFVPFDTAFLEPNIDNAEGIAVFLLNRILDLVFMFDMYLTFHLCIPDPVNPGCLIKDRALIAEYYFRRWFTLDFVSIFPFDIIGLILGEGVSGLKMVKAFRLLRLAKLLRVLKSNRILLHIETHYEIDYGNLQLTGILFMLFTLCHWLACGWYLLIDLEANTNCIADMDLNAEIDRPGLIAVACCYNWLDCINALTTQPEGVRRSYILAVVWSTGEVFTTGSIIDPVTLWETQYKIVALAICGVAYAYLLGALCNIFAAKTKTATKFYEDMDTLNLYLRSENVLKLNPELCVALRAFFRFHHAHKDNIKGILEMLTPALQGSLAYQVHHKWVTKAFPGVFHRCVDIPKTFYYTVAMNLEMVLFAPMESVIEPHEEPLKVFVVISGVVMSKNMRMKRSGASFGEDALSAWRSGLKRGYQATALTHGRMYSVKVETVLKVMHRVQYSSFAQPAMENVALLRAVGLLCWFGQTLKNSILESASLMQACESLTESMDFVAESAMLKFYGILAPRYFRHKLTTYHRGNLAELVYSNHDMPANLAKPILGSVAYFEELAAMLAEKRKKEVGTKISELQMVGGSANGPSVFMAVAHKDLNKSKKTLLNAHHHTHAKVVRILTTLPLEQDDDLMGGAAGVIVPETGLANVNGNDTDCNGQQARVVRENRRNQGGDESVVPNSSQAVQGDPHRQRHRHAETKNTSDAFVREQQSFLLQEIEAMFNEKIDVVMKTLEKRRSDDQMSTILLAEEVRLMRQSFTKKLVELSESDLRGISTQTVGDELAQPVRNNVRVQGASDNVSQAGRHQAFLYERKHDSLPTPASNLKGERHARPSAERVGCSAVHTRYRRSRVVPHMATMHAPPEESAYATTDPHRVSTRLSMPIQETGPIYHDPHFDVREQEHRLYESASDSTRQGNLHSFDAPASYNEGMNSERRVQSPRRPTRSVQNGQYAGSSVGGRPLTTSETIASSDARSCMYTPFYFD